MIISQKRIARSLVCSFDGYKVWHWVHSSSNSILITDCCAITWARKTCASSIFLSIYLLILKSQSLKFQRRRRGGLGAKLSGFKFAIAWVGFTGAGSSGEQKWGVRIKIGHWTLGLWPKATAPTSNPHALTTLCIYIPVLTATLRHMRFIPCARVLFEEKPTWLAHCLIVFHC